MTDLAPLPAPPYTPPDDGGWRAHSIRLAAEKRALRDALRELHRAYTEHDGSDADDARLQDAVTEAQHLAPTKLTPLEEAGF